VVPGMPLVPGTTEVPVEPTQSTQDRVAVVRPSEGREDTAAWDLVAGAGALAFLVPLAASQARKAAPEPDFTPDFALRETEPWEESAELATYQRKKAGEGESFVEDRPPLMCSAAPPPEPVEEEPEADPEDPDAEEEPRTAANLL
jgi:hypothetical protein